MTEGLARLELGLRLLVGDVPTAMDNMSRLVALHNCPEPRLTTQLGQLLLQEKPRRKRRPSLTSAIKQVRAAGIDKGTVTVGGDVSVTFGEPDPTAAASDWPLTDFPTRVKQ